ncbi:MAG: hypothetical protein HDS26_04390 [Bacteroides sp.]|nr:hypothetical protein [Bacteroides sp.]MBD5306359.1 hypothetical protein [Bacteroides sp.]
MCKDRNIKVGIKKLDFSKIKGKFLAYLTDGREITIPISFFPDIKKMSVAKREEWMILDDQYFTFANMGKVYSVADLFKL